MGDDGVFHLEDEAVELSLPRSYGDPSEKELPWWGGAYWPIEPRSSTLGFVLRMWMILMMTMMVIVMVMTKMVIMPEGATAGAQLLCREGVQ